jgi:hypothetical protein
MKHFFAFASVIFIAFVALNFEACKKASPTEAEITVLDSTGKSLAGATVYINSKNNTPPGTVEDTKVTDNRGKTFHTFENEAILQVEVSKSYSGINLSGYAILRLEEGKKVDLTIRTKQ